MINLRAAYARWADLRENERRCDEESLPMCPGDMEYIRHQERQEVAMACPHLSESGITLTLWINAVWWRLELAQYILTGKWPASWLEQAGRDADEQLLSYAY